jgi:RND family efflux transporter MFP subunit
MNPPFFSRSLARRVPWLAVPLAVVLAAGCERSHSAPGRPKIEVIVTTPITDKVTDYQDFTGRLDALKTVDIRARVSGYITKAPFKEGDEVHEGDLLFEIDPRTYVADRNQAEANLKLAEADSKLQQRNAIRAQRMRRDQAMSQEDYDTVAATAEKAKATVKSTEAARDRAQLYVEYTRVTAPWSGRISRRLVDPGNLVNADNTILTTMVTEDPLYAYFDVDERTYLDLVDSAKSGQSSWFEGLQFPVLMSLANEANKFEHAGTVNFVDNRVNASTGTIRMRGVFPNPNKALKPNLFARIRLPIGNPYNAILISDEAILSDQGRKYVYVVNYNKDEDLYEVVYRPVTIGQEVQGLRVIKEGLALGERVIVSGMQRVKPNDKVRIREQPPPKPPESSLSRFLTLLSNKKPQEKQTRRQEGKEVDKAATKNGSAPAGN